MKQATGRVCVFVCVCVCVCARARACKMYLAVQGCLLVIVLKAVHHGKMLLHKYVKI